MGNLFTYRFSCVVFAKLKVSTMSKVSFIWRFHCKMCAQNVHYSEVPLCFRLPTAKWLASEVLKLLQSGILPSLLLSESKSDPASSRLSLRQEELVGVVCRLPDVLANRLGQQLKEALFPKPYFELLGVGVAQCLESIHKNFKGK